MHWNQTPPRVPSGGSDAAREPGEWQRDSSGKRFRRVGRCIEYEPTILTSHGTLTQAQLSDMNARAKDKPPFVPIQAEPPRDCPFKGGAHTDCDKEACAWYTGDGCVKKCPHPETGKKCPYKRTACTADCALRSE